MDDNDDNQQPEQEVPTAGPASHLLETRWTLWFDAPHSKMTMAKYGSSLSRVFTFDTAEDFWRLYNNIRTPSQLQPTATFYLFKQHIEPKWEDPLCVNGGCWTASIPLKGPAGKQQLDAWWLNAVLACIGEQFTDYDEVCGIAVNIRPKGDRIELWTKTASNESAQVTIGRQLKQYLDMPDVRVAYSVFSDKLTNTTRAKDRYVV